MFVIFTNFVKIFNLKSLFKKQYNIFLIICWYLGFEINVSIQIKDLRIEQLIKKQKTLFLIKRTVFSHN